MNTEILSNHYLKKELSNLLSNLNSEEIGKIFWKSLKEAFKVTSMHNIANLIKTIIKIFKLSIDFLNYMFLIIENEKFYFWKRLFLDYKKFLRRKIIFIKKTWKSLSYLEKKAVMIDLTIITVSALVFGGGLDFEGGAPDLDLKFGIGNHRNLFSHTILLGLTLEFGLRFIGNVLINLEKKGIKPNSEMLSLILSFIKGQYKKVIKGMWIGLFFHYLKDSKILFGKTKPYTGLYELNIRTHKRIFATNAILSAIFANS